MLLALSHLYAALNSFSKLELCTEVCYIENSF